MGDNRISMGMNCRDCDKPLATNADIDCCHPECDGCAVCEAFCWSNFHSGCPTPIDWRERYDRLRAELERLRRDYLTVADAVAPESTGAEDLATKARATRAEVARLRDFIDAARAECDRLNKYIETHDEEYATMKETLRAEHQECQRLRADLAAIKKHRAADLTAEDREALAHAAGHLRSRGGDIKTRAARVIVRLLNGGK